MNTYKKIGAILLLCIALGYALPIKAQIKGLYDVKVNYQHSTSGTGWDDGSVIFFDKDVPVLGIATSGNEAESYRNLRN